MERYGHWTVLAKPNGTVWLCRCVCGTFKVQIANNIRIGRSKSCGCQADRRKGGIKNRRHGMDGTPTYRSWVDMRRRCNDPRRLEFPLYGGRGISVCKEWNRSFEAFYRDMGERPRGLTLDRLDNNGAYCKDNCRWADLISQARNRRGNRLVKYKKSIVTLAEASERSGIPRKQYQKWIDEGVVRV